MKKLVLLILLLTGAYMPANAKIAAPKPVPPVVHEGLEYRAPNSAECPGCIEVVDLKTGEVVDKVEVYKTNINPKKERDVQWVFINFMGLTPNNKALKIGNTRGTIYHYEFSTKAVKMLAMKKPAPSWWAKLFGN